MVTAASAHRVAPRTLGSLVSAVGMVTGLVLAGGAATQSSGAQRAVVRLAGADRFGTAAAISAATFSPGVAVAYLATGLDFPDALAGAAAAGGHGPVLLVGGDGVPAVTSAELARLAPRRVVVLGGPSSVSEADVSALGAAAGGAPVTRLAGADRFGTAAAISAATFPTRVPMVYLATGLDFPDALAGAAAAGGRGPLLLVAPDQVPNVTAGELRRLNAGGTTVFGGASSVGDPIAQLADAITAQGIPAPSPAASQAVATAQAQLGKPYAWGGAGPESFDCSGLTAFAWKPAGAVLPHNAAAQDDMVASIPLSALAPGDLVFYGSPVYHEGIYIGNGDMIEAAHTGTPVRISPIDRPDLAGAGRPLPVPGSGPPTSLGGPTTTGAGPPGGPTTTTVGHSPTTTVWVP
jgi:hypothetical protein